MELAAELGHLALHVGLEPVAESAFDEPERVLKRKSYEWVTAVASPSGSHSKRPSKSKTRRAGRRAAPVKVTVLQRVSRKS